MNWFVGSPSAWIIHASEAATEEAPDTATLHMAALLAVTLVRLVANIAIAIVPVVAVMEGPTVVRSVSLVTMVDCEVATVAVAGVRAANALAPVDTKILDAAVALATAVSFRLSRTY